MGIPFHFFYSKWPFIYYRPRSEGDNVLGSVRPFFVFMCLCSYGWTIWPTTQFVKRVRSFQLEYWQRGPNAGENLKTETFSSVIKLVDDRHSCLQNFGSPPHITIPAYFYQPICTILSRSSLSGCISVRSSLSNLGSLTDNRWRDKY